MADSKVITQNDIKNILAHINLGDDAHKEITQAEFNALPQAERDDGTIYFITDGVSGNVFLEDNVPIGTITPYGGDSDPDYWLICDGRAISRTTYSDLFAVIGTTYGTGDGSTTFNIPDLRGNVAVGASAIYDLGDSGGEATHMLNQNELPAISGSLPHQAYGEGAVSGVFSVVDSGANVDQAANASSPTNRHYELHFGNNQPHNNMQPYIVTNYIIKAYSTVSEHQATVDFFYPVGSYYETSDSTFDPNIRWGGTWESENDIDAPYTLTSNEQAIGTWINGKTLFRKIISGTSSSGSYSVSISNLNIETIVKGDIVVRNTSNNTYIFGSYVQDMTTDKFNWYVSADNTVLYLRSGSSFAFGQYYIILEYTKKSSDTTDKAIVRWHRTA